MSWFNLGLTIVDSLDTLLILNLMEEYQEARHWVANHLKFPDGANVQVGPVSVPRIMISHMSYQHANFLLLPATPVNGCIKRMASAVTALFDVPRP